MSSPSPNVFVSTTTRDLGKCRDDVADSLRRAGCHVRVQEDFTAHSGKFLEKLRDYVASCELVVCLIGEHFGWQPPDAALIPCPARDAYPEPLVSATEWEYFLARDGQCEIFLYLSAPGFVPEQPSDDTPENAAAHTRFRKLIENSGYDCNRFTDAAQVPQAILEAFHLRLLKNWGGHPPRILPKKAQHFTGRGDDIAWVKEQLLREKRVALLGPGGIGKTAIAHEAIAALAPEEAPFAHFPGGLFLHDFYAAPGHLAAIGSVVAQAGLHDLKDDDREPRARALLAGAPALVYLEGCEKAEDLPRFLDLCGPATVLITSRRDRDGKDAATRRIEALPLDEAAAMLRLHADADSDETDAVWEKIAALLGRHALALRLAGHRLRTGNETPAEFHDILKNEGLESFDDNDRQKESLELLFRHSAEALSAAARSAWYVLALHALAPLHLAPIAASLGLDTAPARKAVGELVRHSLAEATRMPSETIGETEPAWLLAHALLPEWGKKRLGQFGVEKEQCFGRWLLFWGSFLDRGFHASGIPGGSARYTALTEHLVAFLGGIEQKSGGESWILGASLTHLGNLHRSMGRYAAAEVCYRRDLAIAEKTLGPEHSDTLASLNNFANLLKDRGDLDAAEPLYRRALKAMERTLGPEHPDTLASLNNFAVLLWQRNDLAAAERLYRRVLDALERTLGAEHPSTLGGLNNLALVINDRGDLAGAEPLYGRALEVRERTLGPEHPDTLQSIGNLARLLTQRGDLAGAEPLYRRAQKAMERMRGPEHPETLANAVNLALLLGKRGELSEAERLSRLAVEGFRKQLLPQHPWRQGAEEVLAWIQAARGGAETPDGT